MTGSCGSCRRPLTFDPALVPFVVGLDGLRSPLCRACVARLNELRRDAGLALIMIPPGAYEEPGGSENR